MKVAIEESGNERLAPQIDFFGDGDGKIQNLRVGSDRQNAPVLPDRNRARSPVFRHRQQVAVK